MNDTLAIKEGLITKSHILATFGISALYLFLSAILVGYKTDQLVLVVLFNSFYYLSPVTRKFILGFSIFIVYWILFDYMKAFPNYLYNTVSIENLYNLEKRIFGIFTNKGILTPNEFLLVHQNTYLDIMGGIFYLLWIPVPLAFATYLFFKNKKQFLFFSLTFVLVNLLGFVVYYIYPAAPPWYVQYFGFEFQAHTASNPGSLLRFDHHLGLPVFQSIYSKGSNVFAAMPSLHSSYPVIVLYYGIKNRLKNANVFFGVVMLGIWFTAIYSTHHYVLDVLAGIICAIVGIALFNYLVRRKGISSLLNSMETVIS